jgi:hypothetical protein
VKNPTFDGSVNVSCPVEVVMVHLPDCVEVAKLNPGPEAPLIVVVADPPPPLLHVDVATTPDALTVRQGLPLEPRFEIVRFDVVALPFTARPANAGDELVAIF